MKGWWRVILALAGFGRQSGVQVILDAGPDLTPAEMRAAVERELSEARGVLEMLKVEVDVQGRRR